MAKRASKVIVTEDPFRLLYPNLFTPRKFRGPTGIEQGEAKYSLTMLFDATGEQIKKLAKAAQVVAAEEWPGRNQKELKFPFHSGAAEQVKREKANKDGSFYEGQVFVKSASQYKPVVADAEGNDIIDPSKVYSGVWAKAEINFVAYPGVGSNPDGITAYVNFVLIWEKGDRIAQRTAKDVFADVLGKDTGEDPTAGIELDDEIPF